MSAVKAEPYDAYKDSGVYWVDKIPDTWRVLHLKNCVSKKITDGPHATPVFIDEGVPFLSAEAVQDGSLNFSSKRGYISDVDDKIYSLKCKPKRNDIFIVKSGSTTGKVGYVSTDENFNIWSPLALVRCGKHFDPRYVYLFLSSSYFQQQVQMFWSFGTQPNIGMGVIEALQITVPPHHEQTTIAAYLDTKTAQIDRQIYLLSQKVTQYGKLKQSLINETVTRGIDKSVPMKDSGVEWIGEVPEHWTVTAVTNITDTVSKKNYPNEELLSVYRDYGVIIKSSRDDNNNKAGADLSSYKLVEPGFLVINKMKAWQGSLGVSEFRGIVSPAYITCKTNKRIVDRSYLHHLLRCRNYINEYNRLSFGVRVDQWDMRYDDFKYVPVLLPPMAEQAAIAKYLDEKTAQMDRIVTAINTQIDKLKDLRKALINDVVTGKIKVASEGLAI